MKSKYLLTLGAAVCSLFTAVNPVLAQGTAFTYQGRLNDGTNPANGTYDFHFTVYNASTNGGVFGGPLTNSAVAVSSGLFTVTLDFGSIAFPGQLRWLEIAVCTNGSGDFTTLAPRQQITATPYAILARNLSGPVASSSLAGTYSEAVTFNNAAGNSFSGSGAGLTALNAGNISIGLLDDARLSGNVALRDANQTFTGTNTFNHPANSFTGSFTGNGASLFNLSADAITGGLTTNLAVLVPGGFTNILSFTNGILRAIQ